MVVVIFYFSVCYPQSHQTVRGIVFNAKSGLRIGSVSVKNTRSVGLIRTNDHEEFRIFVSLGDTLELNSEGYAIDRIIVEDFRDKIIQLQPQNSLAEVVVKVTSISQDLQEVGDGYISRGIFYKGKPPLALLEMY